MSFVDDFQKQYAAENMDVHSGLLSTRITFPGMHEKAELKFDLVFKTAVIYGQGYDVLFDGNGVIDVTGSFRGKQEFGSASARDAVKKGDLKWAEWNAYDSIFSALYRRVYPLAVEITWEQRDKANRMNEKEVLETIKADVEKAGWNGVDITNDQKGYTLHFHHSDAADVRETYDNLYDLALHLKSDLVKEIQYADEKDKALRENLAEKVDVSAYVPTHITQNVSKEKNHVRAR